MIKLCHVCHELKEHKSWKSYTCTYCLTVGIKWCVRCQTAHPITNFHKNGNTIRSACKKCECERSFISHEENGYYAKDDVKKRRNANSSACKRSQYANNEEYRSKELQRCRVREATKDFRGYYTEEAWLETINKFDCTCAYCGSTSKLTREHVIPLISGGSNTIDNVIPACISCNSSKSDSELVEWYTARPFYSKQRLENILKYMAVMKEGD